MTTYAATVTAASNAVTATPRNSAARVALSYNGKNVKNGDSVTWASGATPLTITVTNGNAVKVYTVTVTKS